MDDAPRSGETLATAKALTASLDTMSAKLDAANRYGRRNRHMIWGLIVLTVVIAAVAVQANHASSKATRASDRATQVHNQQVVTCLSSNEARANNRELWDKLFSLTPSRPRPEEEIKQLADFKAFVSKTFAPRDCSKI